MIFKNEQISGALFNIENFSELPTCGVEDVDRAVFNLFNEKLPLFCTSNGESKRIECDTYNHMATPSPFRQVEVASLSLHGDQWRRFRGHGR